MSQREGGERSKKGGAGVRKEGTGVRKEGTGARKEGQERRSAPQVTKEQWPFFFCRERVRERDLKCGQFLFPSKFLSLPLLFVLTFEYFVIFIFILHSMILALFSNLPSVS